MSLWMCDPTLVRDKLAELCEALGARAAGCWQLEPDLQRLVQVAFVPGAGLDATVAGEFVTATASVSLSHQTLGIVAAAIEACPVVSRAAQLPANSGSGRWLRAFGANRSVAVPIHDPSGAVQGILSIALPEECQETDDAVIRFIQHMTT
jgi:hypothetical protein